MALNKRIVVFLLVYTAMSASAQVNRFMVFFKDKPSNRFSVSNPSAFLTPRAIERRVRQNIDINEQDLPVDSSYVANVRSTGAEVYFRSKWYNAVLVQCDQSLIPSIESLSFVNH